MAIDRLKPKEKPRRLVHSAKTGATAELRPPLRLLKMNRSAVDFTGVQAAIGTGVSLWKQGQMKSASAASSSIIIFFCEKNHGLTAGF